MINSNLEFRKIKSLNFLFEINENGTILRNVKSKKHALINIISINNLKYAQASLRRNNKIYNLYIHNLVAECWLGDNVLKSAIKHIDNNTLNNNYRNLKYENAPNKIKIKIDGVEFDNMFQGACYISKLHKLKLKTIYAKLKKRRSYIYNHKILYLNAETRRMHSTE